MCYHHWPIFNPGGGSLRNPDKRLSLANLAHREKQLVKHQKMVHHSSFLLFFQEDEKTDYLVRPLPKLIKALVCRLSSGIHQWLFYEEYY